MVYAVVSLPSWTKIALPQLNGIGAAVTALQLLSVFGSFSNEAGIATQSPYSKFAAKKKLTYPISSKLGMLVIYSPALIWVSRKLYETIGTSVTNRYFILTFCLVVHFAKRVFETLFIHRYSGNTDAPVASFIGLYYVFTSWITLHFQHLVAPSSFSGLFIKIGLVLFSTGELGNLYHHVLLANLRKNGSTDYKIPTGGLFSFVATPHYFFELIAWLGIALVAQQGNALLVVCSMSSYLAGRSVATNRWNMEKLPGYDKNKKNIIPFVF